MGDTIVFRDDSYEIVKSLRGKVKQYVVSNGTVVAQEKKLRLSGLGELMDGIFLSEALGVEKPNVEFFERMFETIGPVEKDQVLIVGDSLTSDIRGGNNAGIKTCWYNPDHKERYADVKIDYEIADLHEIYDIIGTGEWE
ncbi:MAG: HAD family hydrolase [Oliverpabstia sp.]